jgi:hypothetical protein
LLESSWSQLLILSLAQWGLVLSREQLVGSWPEGERADLTSELRKLAELTSRLAQLR